MKKRFGIIVVSIALVLVALLTSCGNRTLVDTTYKFEYAVISLPDGRTVSGKVTNWTDYEDSDAVQVTIDGNTYYTYLANVCLMTKSIN